MRAPDGEVLDHLGGRWHVKAGDPALKAVNLLRRKGYGLVVLPVSVLKSGELPESVPDESSVRMRECLAVLAESS